MHRMTHNLFPLIQKIAKAQDNADRTGANSFSSNKNQEQQNKLLNIKNEPKTDVSFKKIRPINYRP